MTTPEMDFFGDSSYEGMEKRYYYQIGEELKFNLTAMSRRAKKGRTSIRNKFKKWGWAKKLVVPEAAKLLAASPASPPATAPPAPPVSPTPSTPPTPSNPSTPPSAAAPADLLTPEARAKVNDYLARKKKPGSSQ